jgi:glycosyltransferase involved in cell wall biosynthesis
MPELKSMRIGIDCDILKNHNTGVENYTKGLICSIKDHNPILIHEKNITHALFKINKEYILPKRLRFPGSRSFYNIVSPPKLPKLDIIHLPTVHSPFLFKPKNLKVIVTVHDITPLIEPKWHNIQRNIFFRLFLGNLLALSDKIISVSLTTKNDLIRFFPKTANKTEVVYSGISEQFKPEKKNLAVLNKYNISKDYILCVGTLEPRKNIIRTIKAYEKSGIKESLVIVGPRGWKDNSILSEIKSHKNKIIFTGFVPQSDLPQFYSSAKAFIYPSLYEGFGFPVIEAMKCATPVITSNISSTKEIGQGAALLVDPYNIDDIAKAMKNLLSNNKLHKELSEKGLKHSQKFNWKDYGQKMEEIYRNLLK